MTETSTPSSGLAEDLEDELPENFEDLSIDEMVEIVNELSDRYDNRELHFMCTDTEVLVIYDRENDATMQVEKEL
ncbi:MAG: hypothetical protein V5A23_07075 [Halobacteriales archaeon]